MRLTSLILIALCLTCTNAIADIIEVGIWDDPGQAYGIAIDYPYLYLADYTSGLRVVDIQDPSNMAEVGFYNTPGESYKVIKDGNYCYVADGSRGLSVHNVSDPSNPIRTDYYDTPSGCRGVAKAGSYVYVADYFSGMLVIDVTNPNDIRYRRRLDTAGESRDVAVSGSYAYIADYQNGLVSVDISNPLAPVALDSVNTPGLAMAIDISGNYAFVADGTKGLRIFNISNPADLIEVGLLQGLNAQDVVIVNSRAWIADNYGRLYIANVSDPTNPFGIQLFSGENVMTVSGVGVNGDYAYVAALANGLRSYNVGDAYLIHDQVIPAQENVMVGIPIHAVDGNCETLFRDDFRNVEPGHPRWRVSRWDVPNQTYLRYHEADYPNDVGGEPPDFTPGLGFWVQEWPVRPTTTLDITVGQNAGIVAENQRFVVTLQPRQIVGEQTYRGMNMIANPYPRIYDWRNTSIRNTTLGQTLSIANAATAGWISGYGSRWDYVTHSYVTVNYSGVGSTTLNPWEGFWVEVTTTNGIQVHFQPEGWSGGLAPELPDDNPDEIPGWELPLQISNFDGSYVDTDNHIGVHPDASDNYDRLDAFEFTPMSDSFVQLYFPHQFEEALANQYTYDFRSMDFTESKTWDFSVRIWYMPNHEFTLTWPGIGEIDNSYRFILESTDTDEFIADLRTENSFVFNSNNTNDQLLHFRLIVSHSFQAVEPGDNELPGGYELLAAYPNPFNNEINFSFQLPSARNIKLGVFDIQGRELALISQGLQNAGRHDLIWNASDYKSGLYLIKLEAGDQTAIQKVLLLR